jgi:hypothetical protein
MAMRQKIGGTVIKLNDRKMGLVFGLFFIK